MAYSPLTSYNYTPMTLPQFTGAGNQAATQGLDFARWLAGQGIDLANLARTDRNTQLAVQNAFQQQQADREYGLQRQQQEEALLNQRLAREAALRGENWSRSLQNPAVSGAVGQNVSAAFSSPWWKEYIEQRRLGSPPRFTPYGQKIAGYTTTRLTPKTK